MKCEYCGAEDSLPFVCNYCGGVFCGNHRLPEAHQCKGDLSVRRMVIPPPTATTYSEPDYTYSQPPRPRSGGVFSSIEIRDITIAWLGLGLAFFIGNEGIQNLASLAAGDTAALGIFLIMLLTVGAGFVLHELSHKFTAQRYGYWAEFRMWPFGLVLALVTSVIGFIFAAPGATYISGANISESENGKISAAGPITNIVVAGIFLPFLLYGLATSSGFLGELGLFGVYVNLFLAIFNLLPVLPLDGAKVFRWSKVKWASLFFPLVILFVAFLYTMGFI